MIGELTPWHLGDVANQGAVIVGCHGFSFRAGSRADGINQLTSAAASRQTIDPVVKSMIVKARIDRATSRPCDAAVAASIIARPTPDEPPPTTSLVPTSGMLSPPTFKSSRLITGADARL